MKRYFVYILASKRNGTLYIGSTTDLIQRLNTHKDKSIPGFTQKYDVTKLVYIEEHNTIEQMGIRERRLKNWPRKWKLDLIEKANPSWTDLSEELSF